MGITIKKIKKINSMITGEVFSYNDERVENAVISIYLLQPSKKIIKYEKSVLSDECGYFSAIISNCNKCYRIKVCCDDKMKLYKTATCDLFIPYNTEICLKVVLEKEKKSIITGVIKDVEDIPIKGKAIQLYCCEGNRLILQSSVITDCDGVYSFVVKDTKKRYTIKC